MGIVPGGCLFPKKGLLLPSIRSMEDLGLLKMVMAVFTESVRNPNPNKESILLQKSTHNKNATFEKKKHVLLTVIELK